MRRSKLLAVLLLLALALTCVAGCGGTEEPSAGDGPEATGSPAVTDEPSAEDGPEADGAEAELSKLGVLIFNNLSEEELSAVREKIKEKVGDDDLPQVDIVYFDTLSAMLLALQAGQIDLMGVPTAAAKYIVAGNDALTLKAGPPPQSMLSMAVMEENTELLALLNDALAALQADGTIDALVAAHIDGASSAAEPAAAPLPVIEGADTIRVAVTGDLPPIDFITAAGEPAGFNVALLSAISEQAGVNIELVNIDSGARVLALTSGRADAVFWVRVGIMPDGTTDTSDVPPGVALTDHYYTDTLSEVSMK